MARMTPGDHRLARLAGTQPLGDTVDIEVDDRVLRQVALAEGLVFRPQPLADLAHRGARQEAATARVLEGILDVASRKTARVKLHRQILQRLGAPGKVLADRRDERLGRLAHLRGGELHHPFRRLHPARPVAVAVAARLALGALVALAADRIADLPLQGFLQNQLRRQQHQARSLRRRPKPAINQGTKPLACLLGRGYSLHRDAPWGRRRQPKARSPA
jgi:hypothetical protein